MDAKGDCCSGRHPAETLSPPGTVSHLKGDTAGQVKAFLIGNHKVRLKGVQNPVQTFGRLVCIQADIKTACPDNTHKCAQGKYIFSVSTGTGRRGPVFCARTLPILIDRSDSPR